MSWREVKQIDGIIHRLVEHGYPPTHLVTIMPSTGTPSEQKRACTRAIAHLGQALKRHGKPHIGLTIFEYPTNADHHVHHLVSAPPGEFATIARRHRPPEVHVKKIGDLPGMISYLTKERRRLSRDFEAKIERCWEGTRPLRGNRWR